MTIQTFTFNPFSENTYLISDETGECIIIDPGMMDREEDQEIYGFIERNNLTPKLVLNTHCHIDHILGNDSATRKYGIELWAHELDLPTLERGEAASMLWNIPYRTSPLPNKFVNEGDIIRFGSTELEVIFVPGHAPGHVAFIHHASKSILSGDVLFKESVGRVDLPGCNREDLGRSIREKLYTLPDDYTVYPGHGPTTTIGHEKVNNVFVRANYSAF
jgi:glyoxylase-like metal-dependent hydrolase (beta-lactamase superfamily II)